MMLVTSVRVGTWAWGHVCMEPSARKQGGGGVRAVVECGWRWRAGGGGERAVVECGQLTDSRDAKQVERCGTDDGARSEIACICIGE